MYIVATGSRDLRNRAPVVAYLDQCLLEATGRFETLYILVGDCPSGADLFVRQWASERRRKHFHVKETVYEALWDKYRLAAGPIRNERMVMDATFHRLDGCLVKGVAWYRTGAQNKGTDRCVKIMREYLMEPEIMTGE